MMNYKNEISTNIYLNIISAVLGFIGFITNHHFLIFSPFIISIRLIFYNTDIFSDILTIEKEKKVKEKENNTLIKNNIEDGKKYYL